MEVRVAICAAAFLLGCGPQSPSITALSPEQAPPTESAGPEPPDPEPPEPEPEPEQPPPPEIRVTRADERTEILLVDPAEELLAIPDGVAWTQSGEVWVLLDDAEAPTTVGRTIDPHGLTTDGQMLYWIGYEENGRWNRETGEVESWRRFASVNEQAGLAFGDALYGQDRMSLWHIGEAHVQRIRFEMERTWRIQGFRAGKDRLFLGVTAVDFDGPKESRVSYQYLRVRKSGKHTVIPTGAKPFPRIWAVNAAGDLAFIEDRAGHVYVVRANRDTPKLALTEPGVDTVCFCGSKLCTVAEGVLRRHFKTSAETIAEPGDVKLLSCTADRVAWASGEEKLQITVRYLEDEE